MTFSREGGEAVRKWWEDRCIEWCYARFEKEKFGDQKYLDDWPERFTDFVHVLNNKELALAPWNAMRFPYGSSIFYHFHGLRIVSIKQVNIGGYSLPKPLIENIYRPYLIDLKRAIERLNHVDFNCIGQVKPIGSLKSSLKFIFSSVLPISTPTQIKW
jgi:hypothetical protein